MTRCALAARQPACVPCARAVKRNQRQAMSSRYYSVPEVNAVLPQVREAFTHVMQLRAQLKPIYRRLEMVGAAPDRSDFDIELPGAPAEVLRDRAAFKGMIEMLNDELNSIAEVGGNVKDLDTGLVDWR